MSTSNASARGRVLRSRHGHPYPRPGLAFAVVVAMWLASGIALAADPGGLDDVWGTIQGLWPPLRVAVWLFFPPWMLAFWAWRADWSLWLRLAAVIGLAAVTLAALVPPWDEW